MFVNGLGTATPEHCYTQVACWEAFRISPWYDKLSRRSRYIVEQVLMNDNGIATRYLTPANLAEVFTHDPDLLHERFCQHAPLLASTAAERALAHAGIAATDIDAIVVSTCTGYLCPGLTSYVNERLGLRANVLAYDLVGQGCAAALPNWQTAEALVSSKRAKHVLSICVEICSAAFYLDDDPGVLISACLFGDGAGAAVLSAEPNGRMRSIRWLHTGSLVVPEQRNALRFEQRGGILRNILTKPVPQLAAQYADAVLDNILADAGVARSAIATWIWHAGGRDVLLALQERLKLSPEQTRYSRECLSKYGNLSSAFVYFVLQAALAAEAPGGNWWLASFGAGFSSHGALLEVA